MIIHLLKKLIPANEISKRAAVTLPENPLAKYKEDVELNEAESETLQNVCNMMAHAFGALHVNYHLQEFNVPMFSLYIHTTHMLGLVFHSDGIQVIELMSPQDIVELLVQCTLNLPSEKRGEASEIVIKQAKTIEEAIRLFNNGDTELDQTISQALEKNTVITFWFGSVHAMAIDAKDCVINLIERNNQVVMIKGTASPVVKEMHDLFVEQFRKSIKMTLDKESAGEKSAE